MRWSLRKVNEMFGDKKLIGVEVGVSSGDNLRVIVSKMNIETVFGIDLWDKYHDHGNRDHSRYLYDIYRCFMFQNNVRIIHLDSVIASKLFRNESLDFVYIDANHSYKYVREDIKAWLPKVKNGGVLCGHDIDHDDVYKAVDEAFGEQKICDAKDWMVIKNVNN